MSTSISFFTKRFLCVLVALIALEGRAQEQLNVQVFNQANTPTLPTNVYQRIEVDGKGHVWVGTNGLGIVKLNPKDSTAARAFTTHQVRAITKDGNGDIWVGSAAGGIQATTGGVRKFLQGDVNSVTTWLPSSGLVSRYVNGLTEGTGNTIWAAHGQTITSALPEDIITEGGVGRFDGSTWLKISSGLPSSDIRVLSIARAGDKIWAGVDRSCVNGTCTAPYIAEYNTSGGFVTKVSNGLPFTNEAGSPLPRSIFGDSDGRVWVGMNTGDKVIAVHKDNSWTLIDRTITNLPAGTAINFQSITEDKSGAIWIGTSNGLLRFYGNDYLEPKNWTLYTVANGLPSNFINGVAIDNLNNKWLSTAAGIVKINSIGLSLTVIHQLRDKDRKPVSDEAILEEIEIQQEELGVLKSKISVDGSESTSIVFKGTNIDSYTLEIIYLTDENQEGKIVNAEYLNNELKVLYKHPTYFRNNLMLPDYSIHFVLKKDGIPVHYFDIKAVRPPIIMVHGIFGNRGTFDVMDRALTDTYKFYDEMQIYKVAYLSDISFDINKIYIIEGINRVINNSASVKISAGKADVICHSMGGLVARAYIQSKFYKSDINKLITINTPHSGSQITNLILHPTLTDVLGWITYNVMDGGILAAGAAKSMLVDGEAILNLNQQSNLAKNNVPTHVITSKVEPFYLTQLLAENNFVKTSSFIPSLKLVSILTGLSVEGLLSRLYVGDDHDTTVPIESQEGGLNEPDKTEFINVIHPGSNNDSAIIDKVVHLASANPNGTQFSQTSVAPKVMPVPTLPILGSLSSFNQEVENLKTTNNEINNQKSIQIFSNGTIEVEFPTKGFVTSPKSILNISVKGSSSIKDIVLIVGNGKVDVYSDSKAGPSNTFEYTVPTDAVGKIKIGAFGIGNNTIEALDTTAYFIVEPNANLVSVVVSPSSLTLLRGLSDQINVQGLYTDGIVRDLTAVDDVVYSSQLGIINVDNGKVTGISIGNDILTVQYKGFSVNVPVEVKDNIYDQKQSQLIDFHELSPKIFGDPAFALNATASSGLPVSFTVVSGPASLSGSMLTITGAGTVTVRASQPGDDTYEAAASIERSFIVVKANQTISFADIPGKIVGDEPFTIEPTATSGLPVTVGVVSGPITVTDNLVTITGEGTVILKASQSGNDNYMAAEDVIKSFCIVPAKPTISKEGNILTSSSAAGNQWYLNSNLIEGATYSTYLATESGFYTVRVTGSCGNSLMSEPIQYAKDPDEKQSQTISFATLANKTFGDPAFELIAIASSGLPVSFNIVSGPANISGRMLTITGAGTVIVRASQAGDEVYEPAPDVDRSFTVAKANQTISFANIPDKALGNPAFQVNVSTNSGLEVILSIVSGPATIIGNTITLTGVEGNVTVLAQQPGNENYLAAIDVTRNFCVMPAKPSITKTGNQLTSSSAVDNQWYYNGSPIEGAISNTYLADKSGTYNVRVTGVCGSSLSEPINVIIETEPDTEDKIIAFPIPAKDVLTIVFPGKEKWTEVRLIDKDGKVWIITKVKNKGNQMQLNVGNLPRGVYIVVVYTKSSVYRKTILLD